MRNIRKESKEVKKIEETVVEESVLCNKCGKVHMKIIGDSWSENLYDGQVQSFSCRFGYGSPHDGDYWQYDLCEECLLEIIKTFKIVPDGFMQDRTLNPIEKDHQRTFELWKEGGEWGAFINYTVEELEEFRGVFKDEYLDKLIDECKQGKLTY